MNINQSLRELEFRTGIKRGTAALLCCSVLANLLFGAHIASTKISHRETLVPPEITRSFWVDGEKVSPEYLEQMGKFLLDLALNNTPLNCETNRVALLRYVGSGSYGSIAAQTAANCKLIQRQRLSNFFSTGSITTKGAVNSVIFAGAMTRWLGDQRLPDKSSAFRLKLGYSGGRIYLQEITEVDLKATDPFSESAARRDVIEQMQAEMAAQSAQSATSTPSR